MEFAAYQDAVPVLFIGIAEKNFRNSVHSAIPSKLGFSSRFRPGVEVGSDLQEIPEQLLAVARED